MTDNEFCLALENWIRWSRTRHRQGKTYSIEGSYRSPQPWDMVPTSLGRVDNVAGEAVEIAWAGLSSARHKLLLKWHYIYLRTIGAVVKSLRAHGFRLVPADYDVEVMRATLMLREAIDAQNKRAHYPRHNSESGRYDRPIAPRQDGPSPKQPIAA